MEMRQSSSYAHQAGRSVGQQAVHHLGGRFLPRSLISTVEETLHKQQQALAPPQPTCLPCFCSGRQSAAVLTSSSEAATCRSTASASPLPPGLPVQLAIRKRRVGVASGVCNGASGRRDR